MKYLKDTTWQEVFATWKKEEGSDPSWINFATKVKGWPDWESWRNFGAKQIGAEQRDWKIYELDDPMKEIPEMLIGPFTGWQSRLPEKNKSAFIDLINIPEQYEHFKKHGKVVSMLESFPLDTEIMGFIREEDGKIICLEGHHRATAVAIAAKESKKLNFGKVKIALAVLKKEEKELMNKVLERVTSMKN
ncbi:MAG: hypothetical protein COU29_04480 [Candidatus Magasanikbacteria bacterium CG10_big_fil_rev_8_21_14_0_10_36_32]|uniref:Uncharacterized protein n=1 Tax=Candidatus Magasanikbacteria bacterium CG10_big_fil_rev_8_21_14_0_10_36_32 TaxID=1974646 RepID=A0A2M6W5E6_9BACT|nr:MAG: hypothetical protein COU29_04480 [Candidatus Magasanikbacteria bacterium CG10_big_fil_rev_8_21_14_0_10_36_32]